MVNILTIKKLSHFFDTKKGKIQVLHDINLTINQGETIALVGESGSGKTTIARAIAKLINIAKGEIYFHDIEYSGFNAKKMLPLRAKIQMIFQDPHSSLNPRMRIDSMLKEVLKTHNKPYSDADIDKILQMVAMPSAVKTRYPHQFSGGQKQRLAIARALAPNPDLLIADEALAALDISVQAQILNLLIDLRDKSQLSILFISHDLEIVQFFANRVIVLYAGHIVESAKTADIFANPRHPYTQALLAASPRPDPDEKILSTPLKGEVPDLSQKIIGCPFQSRCPIATQKCLDIAPILANITASHLVSCHNIKE